MYIYSKCVSRHFYNGSEKCGCESLAVDILASRRESTHYLLSPSSLFTLPLPFSLSLFVSLSIFFYFSLSLPPLSFSFHFPLFILLFLPSSFCLSFLLFSVAHFFLHPLFSFHGSWNKKRIIVRNGKCFLYIIGIWPREVVRHHLTWEPD